MNRIYWLAYAVAACCVGLGASVIAQGWIDSPYGVDDIAPGSTGGQRVMCFAEATASSVTEGDDSLLSCTLGRLLRVVDSAAGTSLSVLDDWDESDRAKVNLVVGQAGITAGAGAVAANSPRVTLASDDPAVTALQLIDNAISGSEMQVDVVAAIPAGTNNIGDVDIVHPRYDHDNAVVTCGTSSTAAATGLTAGTTQIKFSARTEDIGLCWGDDCACAPASLVGYWLAEGRAEEETADDTALNCCSTGGTGILSVSIRQ